MPIYTNRVYDPIDTVFVRWDTPLPDPNDLLALYPGSSALPLPEYAVEKVLDHGGTAPGSTTSTLVPLTNESGANAFQGMPVYLSFDSDFDLADDAGAASAQVIGLVNDAVITDTSVGDIVVSGLATVPALRQNGVWTADEVIYVDTVAGDLTNVSPTAADTYIARVGICLNTPAGGNATVLVDIDPTIHNTGLTV
jgi:hypothetical protein